MYSSFDIAKRILALAQKDSQQITPMKLLKLVYIMHGWHLGIKDEPLINDAIQAWKYGPVIPELYHKIKRFGTSQVDPDLIDLYAEKELNKEDSEFVETIWEEYGEMTAIELSALTHMQGSAWSNTYNGQLHVPITNEEIKQYYRQLIDHIDPEELS